MMEVRRLRYLLLDQSVAYSQQNDRHVVQSGQKHREGGVRWRRRTETTERNICGDSELFSLQLYPLIVSRHKTDVLKGKKCDIRYLTGTLTLRAEKNVK